MRNLTRGLVIHSMWVNDIFGISSASYLMDIQITMHKKIKRLAIETIQMWFEAFFFKSSLVIRNERSWDDIDRKIYTINVWLLLLFCWYRSCGIVQRLIIYHYNKCSNYRWHLKFFFFCNAILGKQFRLDSQIRSKIIRDDWVMIKCISVYISQSVFTLKIWWNCLLVSDQRILNWSKY